MNERKQQCEAVKIIHQT